MSTKTPMPEKCGAKLRGRDEYCARYPRKGYTRCQRHGAGSVARPGARPSPEAVYAKRFSAISERGQARLQELLDDPQLLNARRSAAVSAMGLELLPLDEPSEEAVMALAKARLRDPKTGVSLEPTEGDLDAARDSLRVRTAALATKVAGEHARTVAIAHKQEKAAQLLLSGVMPVMQRFAERIGTVCAKYIPSPKEQAAFLEELRMLTHGMVAELDKVGESIDDGTR